VTPDVRHIALRHADRADVAEHMAAFYDQVDADIAAHRPVCRNRGVCCHFGRFGHRLFVTTLELTWFVQGLRERWRHPDQPDACPYHVDGVCTARTHRPLGCRVFFCESAAEAWQQNVYERHLGALRDMSMRLGIDYRYVEWVSGLAAMDLPDRSTTAAPDPEIDSVRLPVIS